MQTSSIAARRLFFTSILPFLYCYMDADCFLNHVINYSALNGVFPAQVTNNILNVDFFRINATMMGGIREGLQINRL